MPLQQGAGKRESFKDPRVCVEFPQDREVIIKTQWSGTIGRERTISGQHGKGKGLKRNAEVCFQGKDHISSSVQPSQPPGLFPHTDVFVASPCHAYKARPSPQRPLSQMIRAVQLDTF